MLREPLLSVANALWYFLTRRHILEGRYDERTGYYRNWDGSYRLQPGRFERPKDLEELSSLVGKAERVGCVGAGHSFNDLHLTNQLLVSLDHLSGIVEEGRESTTVSFLGGTRMRQVNDAVAKLGKALPLLPDHNAQSVGGVLATDVHASGDPGYISQYVTGLEVMDARGKVHSAAKGTPLFRATIGGMGCTGIIVKATFAPVPQFHLESRTFTCTFEELMDNLDSWYDEYDHFGAAYFAAADRCVV